VRALSTAALDALAELGGGGGGGGAAGGGRRLLSALGLPHLLPGAPPDACVTWASPAAADDAGAVAQHGDHHHHHHHPLPPQSRHAAPLALREVVIGAAAPRSFAASLAALRAAGAARSGALPSVWAVHAAGRGGVLSGDHGATPPSPQPPMPVGVRLLPSRYSALVFATGGGGTLTEAREALLEAAGGGADALSVVWHGERRGDPGSGQLLLRVPSLEGLDLRLDATPHGLHAHGFNEGDGAYDDDVDPALNPPDGHDAGRRQLGW
jgi:hypothetical protein